MKKLVFGLIATVMFGFAGNAQSKLTQEEIRVKLSTSMSQLVDNCRPSFKKGMSYNDFTVVILTGTGPTYPTVEADNLMKAVYGFLSNGTSSADILKGYKGNEMAEVAKIAANSNSSAEVATKVFGDKIVKNTVFGQNLSVAGKGCWICGVWDWIWGNRDEIIRIILIFWP